MANLYHAQLALGKIGKLNLLHSNSLPSPPVEGLVNNTKSTLANTFSQALEKVSNVSTIPENRGKGNSIHNPSNRDPAQPKYP